MIQSLPWWSQHDAKHRRSPRNARVARCGPNGNIPTAAYLRSRLVHLVVHAWDLLRAARLEATVDPRVVVGLLKVVEPHLDEMLAFGAYGAGPSGTLPPDASPQSRLLDWFGRRP
ncbi:hypothetical protein [Geodermatophilus sp. URMC 63]